MRHVLEARRAVVPDPVHGLAIRHARVVVEGSRIAEVVIDPTDPAPPGTDDVGDLLLTPAFVNAHTHLAMSGLRGLDVAAGAAGNLVESLFFRVERAMTADDVRALARVGAMEALLHGTAVVWDHYYFPDALLDAFDDVGLAGIVAPPLQDLAGPGADGWEEALATTARLADTPDLATRGHGVAVGPHATDTVSDALWVRAAALADRLHLPIHAHLAQSIDELERAHDRAGTTPLGLLDRLGVLDQGAGWLLVHGLYLSDADLDRVDPARHTLVACPRAHALFAWPVDVTRWTDRGVPWVVATDAPVCNDAVDVQRELSALARYRTDAVAHGAAHAAFRASGSADDGRAVWEARTTAFHRHAALQDPVQLLKRVWTRPGALHPALPCGAIAADRVAHLALWDLDHPACWPGDDPLRTLALGAPQGALSQLMVAGRWRTSRGAHATELLANPAWREARREATARRTALLARVGL
ncbi:MAG: amidohydrolase family protein [Alphaproteobacteria bacterium]|nr:amidohydrolase family protein [Alphaproteobacteria bacterium]